MQVKMEEGERDVYVQQLKEVFISCDRDGAGMLDRGQLQDLCLKLQVEEQTDRLMGELLGAARGKEGKVSFEVFKDAFVKVLSEMDGLGSDDEDADEEDADQKELIRKLQELTDSSDKEEMEPKFTSGEKRYGRRSRPHSRCEDESPVTVSDLPEADATSKLPITKPSRRHSDNEDTNSHKDDSSREARMEEEANDAETFEAEGQLNQAMASMENALDPLSEEEHLREIWRELKVGANGALSQPELVAVCQHIGMEEMNEEELQHLFNKLDVDGDGQVSFQEFLQGLFQHGGPTNPPTPVSRTMSTPRQKLKLSITMDDRIHTPSFTSTESGLFSLVDPEGSGYAMPDSIVEAWETLGVPRGADILEYLQFDLNTKVSLGELSTVLEQEARSVEEDNATYQAAIASFVMEIRHLKTINEHMMAQRDKLQVDLTEANTRIANLVTEEDERSSNLERSREREMLELEKRYQDQMKTVVNESEAEKETLVQQSSKQRQKLESEIERLKEEEMRLKERLHEAEKDMEKLEKETVEMAGICNQLEEKCIRQQKDLDLMPELHRKLEEMESNREVVQDEQQKFQAQRLQHLESENKDLKDRTDELTMEVEDLKQQLSGTRRRSKTPRKTSGTSGSTRRSGSILSDYTKPTIFIRRSYTSDNSDDVSEDEKEVDNASLSSSGKQRRVLPQLPAEIPDEESETQIKELKVQLEEEITNKTDMEEALKAEMMDLEAGYKSEIHELREGFERERKEIEQAYKMEITAIEEGHQEEKQQVLRLLAAGGNDAQKKKEFETRLEAAKKEWKDEMEFEVEEKVEEMKRDMLIKAETEKNLLIHQHETENNTLLKKSEEEIETEVKSRLQKREEMLRQEVMQMLVEDSAAMTSKVSLQLEQAEKRHVTEKKEQEEEFRKKERQMKEQFQKEKEELEERLKGLRLDYDSLLSEGAEGLQGQLREDFDRLVTEKVSNLKREVEKRSRRDFEDKLELEKDRLQEKMETEKKLEKQKLEKELEKKVKEDREKVDQEIEQVKELESEKIELAKKEERMKVERELERSFKNEREKSNQEVRNELEKEIIRLQSDLHNEEIMNLEIEHQKSQAEDHKKERERQEIKILQLEKRISELQEQLAEEKRSKARELKDLRQSLLKKYRDEVLELEGRVEDETKRAQSLRQELHLKQSLDKTSERDEGIMTEQLTEKVRKQMEGEFLGQLNQLKSVLGDEKKELEAQVQLLQEELDEMTKASDSDHKIHQKVISTARENEERLKRQIEDLKNSLQQSKNMETKLRVHVDEHSEKEQKNTSSQPERNLETRERFYFSSRAGLDSTYRDKAILEAIKSQRSLLEKITHDLEGHVNQAGASNVSNSFIKETLLQEKQVLEKALEQLHDRMQDLIEQSQGIELQKVKFDQWETERDLLKGQLHAAENRSAEATTALSLAQSEYIRELRTLRENINNMVDIGRYSALNAQLLECQGRVRELENALEERSRDTTKMIGDAYDDNKRLLRQAEDEKEELRRKLSHLQQLLDETMGRLKEQLERCAKTDLLVKDLYLENADLMETLYETEKRQKDAYNRVYKLEQKCRALEIFVKKITAAALE